MLNSRFLNTLKLCLFLIWGMFFSFSLHSQQDSCLADAGTFKMLKVVFEDNMAIISAMPSGNSVVPAGFKTSYVLTKDSSLVITALDTVPQFTVKPFGLYTIHTLVYDSLNFSLIKLDTTLASDLDTLFTVDSTVCFSLDAMGAQFVLGARPNDCAAGAGTLVADSIPVCLQGNNTFIFARRDAEPTVPAGFEVKYILTQGEDLVVLALSDTTIFTVSDTGRFTIHTLVYNPATLNLGQIQYGLTKGADVAGLLTQSGGMVCGALDVDGAVFNIQVCDTSCLANSGSLKRASSPCLKNDRAVLVARYDDAPVIPDGFLRVFVLSRGDSLKVVDAASTPQFIVHEEGLYTIHSLVVDSMGLIRDSLNLGDSTIFHLNRQLLQGGGNICGSLDAAGAKFMLDACPVNCPVKKGKLTSEGKHCLIDGYARIIAKVSSQPVIPYGYKQIYILSELQSGKVLATSNAPEFSVKEAGVYKIQSLIYPVGDFDPSSIQVGITTAQQLQQMFGTGRSPECAAFDNDGAVFHVKECENNCRDISAGQLKPWDFYCLHAGQATLKAKIVQHPQTSSNYQLVYLLTKGETLELLERSATPEFSITQKGIYTIHPFVYDPDTFDWATIEWGATSGYDLHKLLVNGGGSICAALSIKGAARFYVDDCFMECNATAGTLKSSGEPCLNNGKVTLKAEMVQAPGLPDGYKIVYLLSAGNESKIVSIASNPSFEVTEKGKFGIHTLVYHPHTFDLNLVERGQITVNELEKLLVQAGGRICAAFDRQGANFQVKGCEDPLFSVYPNPTSGQASIEFSGGFGLHKINVELLDWTGALIKQYTIDLAPSESIELQNLPAGIYSVRISQEGRILASRKIVKQ